MRLTIFFFFSLFSLNFSLAIECGVVNAKLYPTYHQVKLDQVFMIEQVGSGCRSSSITNRTYWLKHENGSIINLDIIEESCSIDLEHIIFKPKSFLEPDSKYFIYSKSNFLKSDMPSLPDEYFMAQRWRTKYFLTNKEISETLHDDLVLEFEKIDGAEDYKPFISVGDDLCIVLNPNYSILSYDAWMKVDLKEVGSNKIQTTYLQLEDKYLYLGMIPCANNARFKVDKKYQLRSTPVAMNGKNGKTSEWTDIPNPWDEVDEKVKSQILGQ